MIALVVALVVSLFGWGVALSPRHTLSAEAGVASIHPICRVDPTHLECAAHLSELVRADGAAASVENPIDYFYRDASRVSSRLPRWNPYIGSGYPIVFDGHNGHYSPTRWFLRHLPGDEGRDVVIFVRAFVWIAGVSLLCWLCGAGLFPTTLVAIGAAFASSFIGMVDHVFLDVHSLSPWFGVIVAALVTGKIRYRVAFLSSILLGSLLGSLGFIQAQFAAVVAIGAVAAASAKQTGGRSLHLSAGAALGFLMLWPAWLPLVRNLGEFVTSRDVLGCIARDDRAGLVGFILGVAGLAPAIYLAGTPAGFGLIALTAKHWKVRFPAPALAAFLVVVIFGMPMACALPGISGVRFAQHLFPAAQAYFLVGIALGMTSLSERWAVGRPRWSIALVAVACVLVLTPFLLHSGTRQSYMGFLFAGKISPEFPALPEKLPSESPWAKVQQFSELQDRRHFSPWGFVTPNWSAALRILDLRLVAALYPKPFFHLNAGLFDQWYRHPVHGINPDRFVGPEPRELTFAPDFQRVLLVNRVSLLTQRRGFGLFAEGKGPYSRARCRPVADSQSVEAYLCPDVGGVGFFAADTVRVDSAAEALGVLKHVTLERLKDLAVVEGEAPVGKGKIVGVQRQGDDLAYDLDVLSRATFVVADTWFPGWRAELDGKPIAIQRANVGFKAFVIPPGKHHLALHFSPRQW